MKDLFSRLLDWIYKKKCYSCNSSKESIKVCSKCYDNLEHLPLAVMKTIEGKNVYCAGSYSKTLQKLIRGLKYHNQKELAYFLAKFMFEYWQEISTATDFQIIPVPMHPNRKLKRKYNHAELIAEEFARLTSNSLNLDLITRVKDTKSQYKLNKTQRAENLNNAFNVDITKLQGLKRLLIIDDISTTGATFEAMIKEFEKHGIYDITCLSTTTPFED